MFVAVAIYYMSAWGITAGAHRLWAHKSYKAKLPFRILLAIFQSMAFQVSLARLKGYTCKSVAMTC